MISPDGPDGGVAGPISAVELAEMAGMELHPFQVRLLEAIERGDRVTIAPYQRSRRQSMVLVTAAAIANGRTVRILAHSQQQAESMRQEALALLDRLAVPTGP